LGRNLCACELRFHKLECFLIVITVISISLYIWVCLVYLKGFFKNNKKYFLWGSFSGSILKGIYVSLVRVLVFIGFMCHMLRVLVLLDNQVHVLRCCISCVLLSSVIARKVQIYTSTICTHHTTYILCMYNTSVSHVPCIRRIAAIYPDKHKHCIRNYN